MSRQVRVRRRLNQLLLGSLASPHAAVNSSNEGVLCCGQAAAAKALRATEGHVLVADHAGISCIDELDAWRSDITFSQLCWEWRRDPYC